MVHAWPVSVQMPAATAPTTVSGCEKTAAPTRVVREKRLGLLISWLFGLLNREVTIAKKAPNNPLKEEPPLFRLVDFFVTWVNEIMDGARHSVIR